MRARRPFPIPPQLLLAGDSIAVTSLRGALHALAAADTGLVIEGEAGVGKRACAEALHRRGPSPASAFVVLGPDDPDVVRLDEVRSRLAAADPTGHPTLYVERVDALAPELGPLVAGVLAAEGRVRVLAGRDVAAMPPSADEPRRTTAGVLTLAIPTLRERRGDLTAIVRLFDPTWNVGPATIATLVDYTWPGNLAELMDVLRHARALRASGRLTVDVVRQVLGNRPQRARGFEIEPLRAVTRRHALLTLARVGGNRRRAAEALGIGRNTLARLLGGRRDTAFDDRAAPRRAARSS
jgi:transcriptional regulator with AAA-type ATPase domain